MDLGNGDHGNEDLGKAVVNVAVSDWRKRGFTGELLKRLFSVLIMRPASPHLCLLLVK